MNSPFVREQAQSLVVRTEAATTPPRRLSRMYECVLQRPAEPAEIEAGLLFLESVQVDGIDPWELFAQVLLLTNEFHFVD